MFRRALQNALGSQSSASSTGDKEQAGPASPPLQPKHDAAASKQVEYASYSDQLRKIQRDIESLQAAMNSLADACTALSEDVATFARESDSSLSLSASELLNGCHMVSKCCLEPAAAAIELCLLRPLSTLLSAHSEVDGRFSARDKANKEHASAIAELLQLGEKQRQASNNLRSRLGVSTRNVSEDDTLQPSKYAERQAAVVQRAAAAEALSQAMTAGLDEEIDSMIEQRRDVAASLLRDSSIVLKCCFTGASATFGLHHSPTPAAGTGAAAALLGPNTPSHQVVGTSVIDQRALDLAMAQLQELTKDVDGRCAWANVGAARREALKQEAAQRRLTKSQLRTIHAAGRTVPLTAYLERVPQAQEVDLHDHILARAPGRTGKGIVLSCPHFTACITAYLPQAQVGALHTLAKENCLAVRAQPQVYWWPQVRGRPVLPFSDWLGAKWRVAFWSLALGIRADRCTAAPYWSSAAGQTAVHMDDDAFTALLSLARAEGAAGSKDGLAAGSDVTCDDEGSSSRWLSLIEQDVARSYAAGSAFGASVQVQRSRQRRTHSILAGTEEGALPDASPPTPPPARAGGIRIRASRRGSLPSTLAQTVTRVVLQAEGVSEQAVVSEVSMSLDSFLAGVQESTSALVDPSPPSAGRRRFRQRSNSFASVSPPRAHVSSSSAGAMPSPYNEEQVQERQQQLQTVLLAVAASHPSIRYMQGMNGIGRMILEVLEQAGVPWEEQPKRASQLFLALLGAGGSGTSSSSGSPHACLGQLFTPDTACLRLRLYQLERLLLRRLPAVHARLAEYGIAVDAFAPSWLLPLFSNFTVLEPKYVVRVWDGFLLHGWAALLSVCFTVMQHLARELQNAPMETCLAVLSAPRVYLPGEGRHGPGAEAEAMATLMEAALGTCLPVTNGELMELERDFDFVPKLVQTR